MSYAQLTLSAQLTSSAVETGLHQPCYFRGILCLTDKVNGMKAGMNLLPSCQVDVLYRAFTLPFAALIDDPIDQEEEEKVKEKVKLIEKD